MTQTQDYKWQFPEGLRYFEQVNAQANVFKFWACRINGRTGGPWLVVVHWGRIGSKGQTQTKSFAYEYAAQRFVEDKVSEKRSHGYVREDESWVRTSHLGWRPPFAVDLVAGFARVPPPPPPPRVERSYVKRENVRVKVVLPPPEPAPAPRGRRIIDFTEDD
jgi:predicted DNA-binding WGR domain protein